MLRLGCLLFVVGMACLAACQPLDSEEGHYRVARSPVPARMMYVGNYAMPRGRSQMLVASGAMVSGPHYKSQRSQQANEQPEEEEQASEEDEPQGDEPVDDAEEKRPKSPRVAPKRPVAPAAEDDDDEDEESAPRRGGRKNGGQATYSNFFPIVFGSSGGGSRRRSGESGEDEGVGGGFNPGLTAISNSFATGRGAIASSNANAYGGRAPEAMPSNQQYRKGAPSRYRSA